MNTIEGKILLLDKILTFVVQIPFSVKNEDINLVPIEVEVEVKEPLFAGARVTRACPPFNETM